MLGFQTKPTNLPSAKRTRQNKAKMEKRKANHERWQNDRIAAAGRREMPVKAYVEQRNQQKKKKSLAEVRREKKEKQRAKKSADKADAMEIA